MLAKQLTMAVLLLTLKPMLEPTVNSAYPNTERGSLHTVTRSRFGEWLNAVESVAIGDSLRLDRLNL